jgi:hypothetical protein
MSMYQAGDYIRAEFRNERTSETEWMWVRVDSCDDANRLVFGRLDSVPALDYGDKLRLGSQLAVSFDNIREHKKPWGLARGEHTRPLHFQGCHRRLITRRRECSCRTAASA